MVLLGLLAAVPPLAAQDVNPTRISSYPPIQDNSFLVEEAYNQEAGIVQHISIFQIARGTSDFDAAFTQEWPVGSIRHQLSYDIPVIRTGSQTGVGDLGINYRYQLLGDGGAKLAISPRLSVTLPTGDWKNARGQRCYWDECRNSVQLCCVPDDCHAFRYWRRSHAIGAERGWRSRRHHRVEHGWKRDTHNEQQDSANARGNLFERRGCHRTGSHRAKREFSDFSRRSRGVQLRFRTSDRTWYCIPDRRGTEQWRSKRVLLLEL